MIVDLRDYRLAPGARHQLVERCEARFFPEQERLGATVLGTFLDIEDPDRFVWLRAMPDLATRARVLTAFYSDGAMWREQRDEVNAWLVDSDDVLLVRPASELRAPATGASVVGMYSHVGRVPLSAAGAAALESAVAAAIQEAGGRLIVTFATDPAENNYPRHPIRTDEHGLVWFATFPAGADARLTLGSVAQRRLVPTAKSRMR
jgi:hypothetical protein